LISFALILVLLPAFRLTGIGTPQNATFKI